MARGCHLAGGCTVTKNRVYTYSLQVFVTSEDGRNGDIDIVPVQPSYPVAFRCAGASGRAETETFIISPPTITMRMIHGATKDYRDVQRGVTQAGTLSLHYCRPEPQ